MSDYNSRGFNQQKVMYNAYGNLAVAEVQADIPAGSANGETVGLIKIPRGSKIVDVIAVFTAGGAGELDVGLARAVSPNAQDTYIDADALIDGANITAAGIARKNTANLPVALDSDYLIEGTLVAANTAAMVLSLTVLYEAVGTE